MQNLHSSTGNALVIKFCAPLICVVGVLGVFGHDFPTLRFLAAVPLLLLAAFYGSLAFVEVVDGVVRYRRFIKWKEIRRDDILGARAIWPPFIGSIHLKKSIGPWGRLYFLLDKNTESNPFRRGEFPILQRLNSEKSKNPEQTSSRAPLISPQVSRLMLAAFVGILAYLMVLYLTPGNLLQSGSFRASANTPTMMRVQLELAGWMHSLPVQLGGLAIVAIMAVKRRNRLDGWLYGFLSGFGLIAILGHWWS